ncbi:MAG: proton-conducting transporter membrane subunit [Sphaerochaetaceae bacterium]|nr:proton-conducting transporter membrane subunit [Sphaerochaetaceae bacterium]
MKPEDLLFAPVVLPLIGAALVIAAKAFLSRKVVKIVEYIGAFLGLGLPLMFFAIIYPTISNGVVIYGIIGGWHESVGITYQFDGLAWLVNILTYSVCAAAWIYSLDAGPEGPSFTSVFLILTAALSATIITSDIFNLFVCLEIVGISSYILVASTDKPGASLAAFNYLIISASAMVFFLIGVYGLYRITGTLSYQGITETLQTLPDHGGTSAIISVALIIASTIIRVAIMPFSGWLPDAHALAPHAVSAVLSGVLIKVPLFALSRVLSFIPSGASAGQLLGYAGALTAVLAVILALCQNDAKRLLAYHSISQIGYVDCAWGTAIHVGVASSQGEALMTAAFLHAFYHALFKGLLFLSVGTTVDRAKNRDVYTLRGAASILRASGERIPVTLITFLIGALAITAIPPFNGYISKNAISYALGGTILYYLLFVAGVGTVASFIKLSRIYWQKPNEMISTKPQPVPITAHISQLGLALICLISGVIATPIYANTKNLLTGEYPQYVTNWYSPATLMKTAVIVMLGAGLYLLTTTKIISRLLKKLRELPSHFESLFIYFSIGTAMLVGWMLWFK